MTFSSPATPPYCSPTGDAQLVIQQVKAMAESSRRLMQALKDTADAPPGQDTGERGLVAIVMELASATTRMARAAKIVASSSPSTSSREAEGGVLAQLRQLSVFL